MNKPIIAITCDLCDSPNGERVFSYRTYGHAVEAAGGIPVWLAPTDASIADLLSLLDRIDGVILAGGDDPCTEPFGTPSHQAITPVHADRQRFETSLLIALNDRPSMPVLGICLGMQMMALHAGGTLDQHMPDTRSDWHRHWDAQHTVTSKPTRPIKLTGTAYSKHRQAVTNPGTYKVAALSDDGVIEAITDPTKRFSLGVQWHPERTKDHAVGAAVFEALVTSAQPRPSNL